MRERVVGRRVSSSYVPLSAHPRRGALVRRRASRSTPAGAATARCAAFVPAGQGRRGAGPSVAGAGRRQGTIPSTTQLGTPTWVWALSTTPNGSWASVILPGLPNNRTGWIHLAGLDIRHTTWWVRATLHTHRLLLLNGSRMVAAFPVGVGAADSPTPTGRYNVTDLVEHRRPIRTVRLVRLRPLRPPTQPPARLDRRHPARHPRHQQPRLDRRQPVSRLPPPHRLRTRRAEGPPDPRHARCHHPQRGPGAAPRPEARRHAARRTATAGHGRRSATGRARPDAPATPKPTRAGVESGVPAVPAAGGGGRLTPPAAGSADPSGAAASAAARSGRQRSPPP